MKIVADRDSESAPVAMERGVAALMAKAEELHISMKTVQAYCARIKEKLHLNSATELLREAILWDQRDKATG
jgi:hypothetical protein